MTFYKEAKARFDEDDGFKEIARAEVCLFRPCPQLRILDRRPRCLLVLCWRKVALRAFSGRIVVVLFRVVVSSDDASRCGWDYLGSGNERLP